MSTTTPPLNVAYGPTNLQDMNHFRYLTVSVYVALLLEHIALLPLEVEYIWKTPRHFTRICFLLYRYSTVFGLAVLMYLLAGLSSPLDGKFCKHALATLAALSVLTMGIADALVMLRVAVLWGRQRFILVMFLVSFLATFTTAVVCIAIATKRLSCSSC